MFIFKDYYNNEVKLSFADHPFSQHPKHVFVICQFQDKWLLTEHKERGLEFPGGNVEEGESAVQGAIREVKEETGALIDQMSYVGQYFVNGKKKPVIKNIYFAQIQKLFKQETYYETKGPVLLDEIPNNIKTNDSFSFIMKDDVLYHSMQHIKQMNVI